MLTKDSPLADGVYGIDNTFASRAVDEGVLSSYSSEALPKSAESFQLGGDAADKLTPVDYSDVCVNVDDAWFAAEKIPPPKTLEDLTEPAYKDLFVTPGATTSSPGLAFLLATIGAEGDGWQEYWKKLMANGAKVTSGWTDAYEVDFTAGGGQGRPADRDVVLLLAAVHHPRGRDRPPTTSALLDTCFRQVEYAGVLKGSENPKGMQKFIDFMLERKFQAALPDNMYVYPVDRSVPLPKTWAKYAPVAPKPADGRPRRGQPRTAPTGCASGATSPASEPPPASSTEPLPAGHRGAGRGPAGRARRVLPLSRRRNARARVLARGVLRPGSRARGARPSARTPGAVVHPVVRRQARP